MSARVKLVELVCVDRVGWDYWRLRIRMMVFEASEMVAWLPLIEKDLASSRALRTAFSVSW